MTDGDRVSFVALSRRYVLGCALALATGCGSESEAPTEPSGDTSSTATSTASSGPDGPGGEAPAGSCAATDGAVISLTTDDGVTLEADLYLTGESNAPGAVLLHMTPAGGHDRNNYPPAFI
ncbi:MAG: hypothetical protein AAGA56_18715, partial [Myxococcota bacterium]